MTTPQQDWVDDYNNETKRSRLSGPKTADLTAVPMEDVKKEIQRRLVLGMDRRSAVLLLATLTPGVVEALRAELSDGTEADRQAPAMTASDDALPAGRGWPRRPDDFVRLPAAFGDCTVNRRRTDRVTVYTTGTSPSATVWISGLTVDIRATLPTLEEAQMLRAEVVRLLTEGDPS